MESSRPRIVVFDCDGVLVDSVSSWKTLHDHFGTDNDVNLQRFIRGEISDVEFMQLDIQLWKSVQKDIHRDDLFRAYAGIKLMPGACETISTLREHGIFIAIVSAGVDIFVQSIAGMLKVDDWIANGLEFDDDGFLTNDGVCRLHATKKGSIIEKLLKMNGFEPHECVSVGDSEMDLSMMVDGSRFIGFFPTRESSTKAFESANVPIVREKDLSGILPYLGLGSSEGN
jgi:phosphoserine phosphatase